MLRLALSVAFVVAAVAYAAPKLDSYALNSGEWLGQAKQGTGVQTSNYRSLTLEADRNGHFRVEAVINGRRLDMMADTGATAVALMAEDAARIAFGAGAAAASFVWFFCLGYGARILTPVFRNPRAWQVLDALIAVIMAALAAKLLHSALQA